MYFWTWNNRLLFWSLIFWSSNQQFFWLLNFDFRNYPTKGANKYYKHWCVLKSTDFIVDKKQLRFAVFGGKDKRINKLRDSYSDLIITRRCISRVENGKLELYYGKNWFLNSSEYDDEDDAIGMHDDQLFNQMPDGNHYKNETQEM